MFFFHDFVVQSRHLLGNGLSVQTNHWEPRRGPRCTFSLGALLHMLHFFSQFGCTLGLGFTVCPAQVGCSKDKKDVMRKYVSRLNHCHNVMSIPFFNLIPTLICYKIHILVVREFRASSAASCVASQAMTNHRHVGMLYEMLPHCFPRP